MAKISNVATSDTFGTWRTRSNAAFDRLSQFALVNSSLYANTVTANNNLNALKNATVTKNLTVSGNTATNKATVTSAFTVSGNTTLGAAGKTITTTGAAAHTGTQTVSTNLTVSGNTATNKATVTSALTVSGNTTLGAAGKTITTTGLISHTGRGTISTNLTISGNTSTNKATVTSALTVSGNTTFSNPITYGGVTLSNSVTGTGSMVLSASPTLTTPALGVATATTLALGGATIGSDALGITGSVTASSSIRSAAAGELGFVNRARIFSPADGIIQLGNWANADFTRLQFGGTTSSFPAIARSGQTLLVKLADDSDYATLRANNFRAQNVISIGSSDDAVIGRGGAGIVTLYNAALTDFSRLQFGGTTSSFPAIKRNATALNFRLADDSADAPITAAAATFSGALTYGGVTLSNSVTGTGSMVLSASPTLTTPALGVATATSLALGGATIGTNALAVTGTASFSSSVAATSYTVSSTGFFTNDSSGSFTHRDSSQTNGFTLTATTPLATPTVQFGSADAALPVAQTLRAQGVVAGTTNIAGANWTFKGSQSTGTGAGGSIIFQTAAAGVSGSTQNALATALTIDSTKLATFAGAGTFATTLGVTGATTLSAALTYGGVTLSNSVTGTGSMVLSASPTLTGTLTAATAIATKYASSTVTALTDAATITCDTSLNNHFSVTLAGNRTFALSAIPAIGTYIVYITQDATGSRTVTWPASNWSWAGGTAPTLTTTAAKVDVLMMVSNGSKVFASMSLNY